VMRCGSGPGGGLPVLVTGCVLGIRHLAVLAWALRCFMFVQLSGYHIRVIWLIRVAQLTTLFPNQKFHVKFGSAQGIKIQLHLHGKSTCAYINTQMPRKPGGDWRLYNPGIILV